MRKSSIIILLVAMLLVGCSKAKVEIPAPQESPKSSAQAVESKDNTSPSAPTVSGNPQKENQPNGKDLEKLIEKSNNTKDEKERAEIMAEIQKILEQAEKNSPKQNIEKK